jgi:hypothetical protein
LQLQGSAGSVGDDGLGDVGLFGDELLDFPLYPGAVFFHDVSVGIVNEPLIHDDSKLLGVVQLLQLLDIEQQWSVGTDLQGLFLTGKVKAGGTLAGDEGRCQDEIDCRGKVHERRGKEVILASF